MNEGKGPDLLARSEDNWETAMGAWFPEGRVVLRGKDVLNDLGHRRWMEYLVYAVIGRESPRLARLIEGLWTLGSSYPDPRLWNNRVAALSGTTRSTVNLAVAAGTAVSEATLYGLRTSKGAIDFLYRADRKLKEGQSLSDIIRQELRKYRAIYGFGRPMVSGDERIRPVLEFSRSLGEGDGHYVRLAFRVHEYLKNSKYKYQINMSALAAALMADQGFSPEDFHRLASLSFVGGMLPCYIDAREKLEGTFFPLRTARIDYKGAPERRWNET
ncbi:MAG: hypothetical protein WBN82_07850 [Porticoccaceae bacterium]